MERTAVNGARSGDRERIVTKAVCNAAQKLGINQSDLANVLGVSNATASRMMKGNYTLKEGQKEFEIAVILLRVFRSLDAITGGDERVNIDWMQNENKALSGVPAQLIRQLTGLMNVVNYLDAQRAPV